MSAQRGRDILLKLDNAVADKPVPQGKPDVDGLGGEFPGLLMDVDDGNHQRLEVAFGYGLGFRLLFHRRCWSRRKEKGERLNYEG